ncbi:MAG: UDP-glucose/GDP-mannose dehydrogenase family protein [Candidatus Nanopelagicaceae bacterium]|nr:UDP-glucose/GDP-mannose dehydrogenase family protein [Candidatus Nanopelagicaceae bacterium]
MKHALSVIGTGYLGATHATCMASLGYTVVGIDSDKEKIARLSRGELPFYEPGLEELLREQLATGRLTFSSDFADLANADVHFICVGTPQKENSLAADLSFVESAIESIVPFLKPGSLVVGKSTVPVGTAQALSKTLAASAPQAELAWNPEFLREGFAIEDTLRPNRIVVGVSSDEAEETLREVFAPLLEIGTPWISADLPTSELVKVAANSFLATKISFINAMAEVCEAAGADVTVLSQAIGYDPRIGNKFLQAGIGFGGGCLPKDIRAFMARADELGANQALEFLREIDAINLRARRRVIEVVHRLLGNDLSKYKIAVLGAAFKPESDDVRDSPALDIASQLHGTGAKITVHDPKAIENARKRFPELSFADEVKDCLNGADIVLHLTEWREYRELKPFDLITLVNNPLILDGRNALDREEWVRAGWSFHALGRADQ